ncbi:hypothetical protein LguiB_030820 [Lonicera macranthoides]
MWLSLVNIISNAMTWVFHEFGGTWVVLRRMSESMFCSMLCDITPWKLHGRLH